MLLALDKQENARDRLVPTFLLRWDFVSVSRKNSPAATNDPRRHLNLSAARDERAEVAKDDQEAKANVAAHRRMPSHAPRSHAVGQPNQIPTAGPRADPRATQAPSDHLQKRLSAGELANA